MSPKAITGLMPQEQLTRLAGKGVKTGGLCKAGWLISILNEGFNGIGNLAWGREMKHCGLIKEG